MNKPVNTIRVHMHKYVSDYNLKTGEVGTGIQSYQLFDRLEIIPDIQPLTIKEKVARILEKNYIDFSDVEKDGFIFDESRIDFQTFEDSEGCTEYKETPYFVDNSIYIEVNNGFVSMDELQEIFPEISMY